MSRFGLNGDAKSSLLNRLGTVGGPRAAQPVRAHDRPRLGDAKIYDEITMMERAAEQFGLVNPFFRVHTGMARDTTQIGNRDLLSFASYNYLGLNGDPRVSKAAIDAIECYGTSVSASRLVSGERPVHGALEAELARVYEAEDCVAMVSGHATNVTVIGHLLGPGDVILHDALAHNSIIQGALLSGAQRISVPHNDAAALERALKAAAPQARRMLVVIEGHYSMDGDIPDLAAVVQSVRRHGAWLMVDEAHSLGVLGKSGLGVAEECGVDPRDVDIWMGTLSKSLVGCGGYVAASREIITYLRSSAPGFVYSVGLPGPMAAAALEALRIIRAEPERVARLRSNAMMFREACRENGLDTGPSIGAAIVPVMIGSSLRAARASQALFDRGLNVQPIIYPAVPERSARLRYFITACHTHQQLKQAAVETADVLARGVG